jgi:hypothetical protein
MREPVASSTVRQIFFGFDFFGFAAGWEAGGAGAAVGVVEAAADGSADKSNAARRIDID